MKRQLVLVVLSLAGLMGNLAWAGSAREDSTERLQNSADVLKQIASAPDKGIPEEVLNDSKCIVVVPHLVKGGFIIGAKHGRGVAVCRTSGGWSAPAFISVGGGSWGLQIGADDYVCKPFDETELAHAVAYARAHRIVPVEHARQSFFVDHAQRFGELQHDVHRRRARRLDLGTADGAVNRREVPVVAR